MGVILNCLNTFCDFSGAKVSVEKTRLYCSRNMNHIVKNDISDMSGFKLIGDLSKYLGIPLHHSRVSSSTYNFILEKVRKRLGTWKINKLSLAGRATLVKSVLNSIPIYYMQSTLLPAKVCEEIDKASRNFVWGTSNSRRRTPLVAWPKICMDKDSGGLGFRHTKGMNKAMLMKLGWELTVRTDKLWVRILRCKYSCGNDTIPVVSKKQVELSLTRGGVLGGAGI